MMKLDPLLLTKDLRGTPKPRNRASPGQRVNPRLALPLQRYVPSRGFSREPERGNALSQRLLGNALPVTLYSATPYTEL